MRWNKTCSPTTRRQMSRYVAKTCVAWHSLELNMSKMKPESAVLNLKWATPVDPNIGLVLEAKWKRRVFH